MSITYKAIVVTNIAWWLVNVQNQLSKAYNTKKIERVREKRS
jgi:hypothetical protein